MQIQKNNLKDYSSCLNNVERSGDSLQKHTVLLKKGLLLKKFKTTLEINELKLKLKTAMKFHTDNIGAATLDQTQNYHTNGCSFTIWGLILKHCGI